MRIAQVITRLIIGGAQENTILTCEGLVAAGHDVTLISGVETGPEGSLWPRAEQCGAKNVRVQSLRRNVHPLAEIRCCRELERIFRGGHFDVVHTHSSKAGILGRRAAHRAGVPFVVHTIHGMSFNRTQPPWVRAAYRALERRAARWTHKFITVADAMIDQAVAAGIAERSRFVTIRSGMETERFGPDADARRQVRKEWGVGDDDVVVGTIARLFRDKGYESLLEALPDVARECPNARFVWVGDGAHRERYVSELTRLGLRDRVHLTGLVPPEEIPRILNGFDLIAHASRWEGLPRALVQAALTEVPAVSFDNDGAPEVVEDGVTGYLAPMGSVTQLAQRVVELVRDGDLRRAMGKRARPACLERFSVGKMVEEIERVYESLAAKPGGRSVED